MRIVFTFTVNNHLALIKELGVQSVLTSYHFYGKHSKKFQGIVQEFLSSLGEENEPKKQLSRRTVRRTR
jgi:hypothetical protein